MNNIHNERNQFCNRLKTFSEKLKSLFLNYLESATKCLRETDAENNNFISKVV